ncbi:hypothetical protein BDD12DRAFT_876035 [Trichophaea hybrida]|nr:hypothetical protein BDD12DRAFT_876035 [Trichophaea hybrida]
MTTLAPGSYGTIPVKAKDSECREDSQCPNYNEAIRQAGSTELTACEIKASPSGEAIGEVRPKYTSILFHQCPSVFQLAILFWITVTGGISGPGKVNYPCGRVHINTNTYPPEGSLPIQIALATRLFTLFNLRRFKKVFTAAIDLLIPWQESDLTVYHDPEPPAIKDFMPTPGAPNYINQPPLRGNSIAIKPDPDEDLEDPLQSIIPIPCEVINLDEDEEDDKLALEAAPVDDDELKLL